MKMSDNSSLLINENWFIANDILMIICVSLALIVIFIFLLVIIFDKTCHTVPMLLITNTLLSEFLFGVDMLSMVIFTLINDIEQIEYEDSLCIFRGFLGYVVTSLQNYSYLLQSLYRYVTAVYPTALFYQRSQFQLLLIIVVWIFAFLCPIPYIIKKEIRYNIDNQICQMPLRFSFLTVYNSFCVYLIPISLIIFVYIKLIFNVRKMNETITPVNTLNRARRELRMVRRIVILVCCVATIGLPYAIFIFMSYFTVLPKYHFRIGYLFNDIALPFAIIILLLFTEPVKKSLRRYLFSQKTTILPLRSQNRRHQ